MSILWDIVCRPGWFTILHSQSQIYSKTPNQKCFSRLMKCPEIIIKNRTWYTHDFNEAVGNNIGNSFHLMMLLLLVFNISIIIYFLWLLLSSTTIKLSQFKFPRNSQNFFSVSKPKRGTNIKDEVRVKSNQIYELITDRSIRCFPSK